MPAFLALLLQLFANNSGGAGAADIAAGIAGAWSLVALVPMGGDCGSGTAGVIQATITRDGGRHTLYGRPELLRALCLSQILQCMCFTAAQGFLPAHPPTCVLTFIPPASAALYCRQLYVSALPCASNWHLPVWSLVHWPCRPVAHSGGAQ